MDIPLARRRLLLGTALAGLTPVLAACSPTVKVEAPDKPIEINLNIRIEQEVRIKVERDLEQVFADDPELFGLPPGGVPGSGGQGVGRKGNGTK
ncbi:YnbE family lipoprotein [Skermanella mucosa]|uniref:YnbE family lipoprotein n=1 Tax=Skermanella mucosa TaxID=1789672 RepID=UPI00192BBA9A|nr:YnbE family lipoprotein [Skermanella mucosa]UEM23051.1 YnbE family lipoprotein [Skermanella mucosa]